MNIVIQRDNTKKVNDEKLNQPERATTCQGL